jgi:hypothetical protein
MMQVFRGGHRIFLEDPHLLPTASFCIRGSKEERPVLDKPKKNHGIRKASVHVVLNAN